MQGVQLDLQLVLLPYRKGSKKWSNKICSWCYYLIEKEVRSQHTNDYRRDLLAARILSVLLASIYILDER
jgi:hypothetical protein